MAGQEGNFTFWVYDSKGFSLALLGLLDFVNGLVVYCVLVLASFLAFVFLVIAFLLFYLDLIICFRIGSAFLVLLQASRLGLSLINFLHQLVIFLFNYSIENILLFCLNSTFVKFGLEQLQMARKMLHSAERPAFFKALMGDFSQDLRIPSAFIKNLRRSLRICGLQGPSGQCWAVDLEKRGNRLFFQKGWERFVKHHSLQVGDFLTFSYDGVSMFDVTIYGKTCCEKIVKPAKRRSESNASADKRRDKLPRRSDSHADKRRVHFNLPAVDHVEETSLGSIIPFQSENSYVAKTLKKDTLYELYITKEVATTEGLRPGMTVKVKDTFGMSWSLKLCGSAADDRVLMRSGLADICKASIASPGDTLIFEFVKPRVVQLHVIKAAGAYY